MNNWVVAIVCIAVAIVAVIITTLIETVFGWWETWAMYPILFGVGAAAVWAVATRNRPSGPDPDRDEDTQR